MYRFARGDPSRSRQEVFYESIIIADERIDERKIPQRESVLKIFGQQVPYARTPG